MFSLDWVSIKAQIMGPAHLINDYVEYGPILDKEVSKCGYFFVLVADFSQMKMIAGEGDVYSPSFKYEL